MLTAVLTLGQIRVEGAMHVLQRHDGLRGTQQLTLAPLLQLLAMQVDLLLLM
jgi:hypothetical protein